MTITNLSTLTDRQLLCEIKAAANHERTATATLIALLAEMDARRLYLGEGCSSLFTYCTQVLRLSEHAAYGRIEAARVARRFPIVLDRVASGSLTLTALTLVAPHLTVDNHVDVLTAAHHRSKREVERLVAALRPKPDASPLVRKLPRTPAPEMPTPAPAPEKRLVFTGTSPDAPSRPVVVAPLAPVRYKVQFTVSRETHDKLRRVQDLLRHSIPNGDPAAIFDRALTLLLNDLERSRTGACERPRPRAARRSTSRHIPASVRRDVWKRDGGRCAFVGAEGRCTETGFLEFHHVKPYAAGGPASTENIELRCRAHNLHEAERYFGSRLPLLAREVASVYVTSTRSGPGMCAPARRGRFRRGLRAKAETCGTVESASAWPSEVYTWHNPDGPAS